MSQTDSRERRSIIDHEQRERTQRDYYDRQARIQATIEKCSQALSRGKRRHYAYVAKRLRDDLLPAVDVHTDGDWGKFDSLLSGTDAWDWVAFTRFRDNADQYVAALAHPDGVPTAAISQHTSGRTDSTATAKMTVQRALESVVAICEEEEIVMPDYAKQVDAVGFSHKIGEHLQDAEMDIGDPVRVVTERSGALKTLFAGGTGQGKSAALETEAEDYYRQNFEPGRDCKLIDLVGLRDGENWFYDIPQEDDELTRAREEMGLPPTFLDADDDIDPEVEILAPLTPGLPDENLPYNTNDEEFVVRPFTVPASEIRKPLLVSMIAAKLTPQQETIIRNAYDAVNRRIDDWALADLAEEIKGRDELGPDKKKPVVDTLASLQNQGFIRTKSDNPHALDWRDIFTDTQTITVFTQAFVESSIAKLIAFGYLADTIVKKRETMLDIPPCALLMRELWKVAPHNQRQAFDGRAASLQEAIGKMLAQLFRENRHSGVHVLADTQQPSDLLKPVREMFNRYVIFRTDRDTVKNIFEWTANDSWKSFYATLTPKPGEASVVGMVEPAIEERHIEFIGPIRYAPPSHHHRIEEVDSTGWRARTKYLETEELRRPTDVDPTAWENEVPTKLVVNKGDSATDGRPDPQISPVPAFAEQCLQFEPGEATKKPEIQAAFNQFAHEHDRSTWDFDDMGVKSRFGSRINESIDGELSNTKRDGVVAYKNLTLTTKGQQYHDQAMQGLSDSAEPIRDESTG